MSTKTVLAFSRETSPAEAKKVKGLVITSSPGPTPSAIRATSSASVPEETPMACADPTSAAKARSNSSLAGPITNRPVAKTSSTRRAISRFNSGS
jgi:hypothetical protein